MRPVPLQRERGDGIRVMGTASGTMIGGNCIRCGQFDRQQYRGRNPCFIVFFDRSLHPAEHDLLQGEEGIDLGADNGLTFNDVADSDTGSNNLVNYPVLRTATTSGTSSIITGNVRGLASTTFRVEFFRTPYGQGDASGYGEARIYMGSTSVTTDSTGNASFSATLTNTSMNTGDLVTATANG